MAYSEDIFATSDQSVVISHLQDNSPKPELLVTLVHLSGTAESLCELASITPIITPSLPSTSFACI
jgi:hypothetical protein